MCNSQQLASWNSDSVTAAYSTVERMIEEDLEVAIKVVVVGNGAVGKSSLIQRYCKDSFTKDYKKTIGVDFLERQLQSVLASYIALHATLHLN